MGFAASSQDQPPGMLVAGGSGGCYSRREGAVQCGSGEVATHSTDSSGSSDDFNEAMGGAGRRMG